MIIDRLSISLVVGRVGLKAIKSKLHGRFRDVCEASRDSCLHEDSCEDKERELIRPNGLVEDLHDY